MACSTLRKNPAIYVFFKRHPSRKPGSTTGFLLHRSGPWSFGLRIRLCSQGISTQLPEQLRKRSDLVGKNVSFGSGNPFQAEIALINPKELQDSEGFVDDLLALFITSQVMAVTDVSAGHHHPVGSRLKRIQQKTMIHSPGAHEPDEPDVGGVLHSRHPCQVGPRIRAPVTQKRDDLGFKCIGHRYSL
jgi:hypothetical protein